MPFWIYPGFPSGFLPEFFHGFMKFFYKLLQNFVLVLTRHSFTHLSRDFSWILPEICLGIPSWFFPIFLLGFVLRFFFLVRLGFFKLFVWVYCNNSIWGRWRFFESVTSHIWENTGVWENTLQRVKK